MRIVGRKEFLSLPPGTVYAKYTSLGIIGDLSIKQESLYGGLCGDWYYTDVYSEIGADDTDEFVSLFIRAESDPNFEIEIDPFCVSRDGGFEEAQKFAVFSPADIDRMIQALKGLQ